MNRTETAQKFIKSDTLPPSVGYSQAVIVKRGNLVYVAGQVAMDLSGKLVGPGDFRAQAEQIFENLKAALAASGASFDNVVKLNSYFVDIKQAPLFREVRDKYVNVNHPPVSTAVEVHRLVREEWLLKLKPLRSCQNSCCATRSPILSAIWLGHVQRHAQKGLTARGFDNMGEYNLNRNG